MRFLFLVLFSAAAFAQNAKVDALFADVDKPDTPGYSVAVIRDGKIVHARGYGMADLERDVKISRASVFDIGSTSKQFTAAAILLLEQEGKLALSDDIRRFLPEMPQYEKPVTIAHLLNHTSGIRDYLTLMALAGRSEANDYSDEETLGWIARQKALNFLPGEDHLYSNSGYYLLSQIVERASGMSLRKYADAKIFKPLGMTTTHFHDDPSEIVKNRAIGYEKGKDGYTISMSRYHVVGDGAVLTTVEDLAKWDANFYTPKVGGTGFLDAMHRTGRLNGGKELTYAAGLSVSKRNDLRLVEHGGAWMGYRAQMSRYPEKKLTVIVLSNFSSGDVDGMSRKIADVYLDPPAAKTEVESAKRAETVSVDAAQLARFAKTYFHPRADGYRRVDVKDGKLWYLAPGGPPRELRPIGADRFELVGGPAGAIVTFTAEGARIDVEGDTPVQLIPAQLATPDAATLAQYAGTYRSEELDASHRIRMHEGALHVRAGFSSEELKLTARERDVFDAGPVLLRFTRDANGVVTGYTVSAGRVRGIAFTRGS